jgi:hypothetical protein
VVNFTPVWGVNNTGWWGEGEIKPRPNTPLAEFLSYVHPAQFDELPIILRAYMPHRLIIHPGDPKISPGFKIRLIEPFQVYFGIGPII